MAASKGAITQAATILIQEAGLIRAERIAKRLVEETHGNQSYEMTIKSLYACIMGRDREREVNAKTTT